MLIGCQTCLRKPTRSALPLRCPRPSRAWRGAMRGSRARVGCACSPRASGCP